MPPKEILPLRHKDINNSYLISTKENVSLSPCISVNEGNYLSFSKHRFADYFLILLCEYKDNSFSKLVNRVLCIIDLLFD